MDTLKLNNIAVVCILFKNYLGICADKCKMCYNEPVNVTEEETVDRYKSLVSDVWFQSDISLTDLGQRLKSIIVKEAQNGNMETYQMAIPATFITGALAPYLDQKPDACIAAAIVNGTLSCASHNNETLIQNALKGLEKKLTEYNYLNFLSITLNSGCDFRCGKSPPDYQITKDNCYADGFVYPVKDYLNLPDYENISPELKDIILAMYESENYNDKALAAIVSFSLSEFTQIIFNEQNDNIIFETEDLKLSGPVKKKCCYSRIKRAEELRLLNNKSALKAINEARGYLSTTECGAE